MEPPGLFMAAYTQFKAFWGRFEPSWRPPMAILGGKIDRRSDTGFGIWDLARKLAKTMAKFGSFGQNLDFFGTILGPFWDCVVILMILPQNNTED